MLDLIYTFPSQSQHLLFQGWNKFKEAKYCIRHVEDGGECVLNYGPFNVVFSNFIHACYCMDCNCTTKRSTKYKNTILINPSLFLAILYHSLGILQDAWLVRFAFTARVPPVCHTYDIDIKFMVDKFEIIKSKANVSRILMKEYYSVFVPRICITMVHEPSLQLCSISALEPDFVILHPTLSRILISWWIVFDVFDGLSGHVEYLLLPKVNH